MTEVLKIALTGKMAAGKDTVGAYLVHNYNLKRFAFGDAIRELCWRYFPERMQAADGKDRKLLQEVGQFMRRFDRDVWVKRTVNEIAEPTQLLYDGVVITDMRQPNEYERLKQEGYVLIRVTAPDHVRLERMKERGDKFKPEDLNHETEQWVDTFDVDYEIENGGTWREMAEQVDVIMREINAREAVHRV
jgi:dephospho-CoA kinase